MVLLVSFTMLFLSCECVSVCVFIYLVYELLHPLHGMVSLQERSHSHETFITALLILFLLPLLLLLSFSPSVVLLVYSSVVIAVRDTLTGEEDTVLGRVVLITSEVCVCPYRRYRSHNAAFHMQIKSHCDKARELPARFIMDHFA